MFVPTRIFLSLLLLMSTLQPYLLLTVQPSALPDIVHSILQPSLEDSNSSNATNPNRTLANGLLGDYTSPTPFPFTHQLDLRQQCDDILDSNLTAMAALTKCWAYQLPLITVLNATQVRKEELMCIFIFSDAYCRNMVARTYCTAAQYAAQHEWLQEVCEANSGNQCSPYAKYSPPLDAPPMVTAEITQCDDALVKNEANVTCEKWVGDKMAKQKFQDPIEALCKTVFEGERCLIKQACQYCDKSADKYLNFTGSIWTPTKVACTKWAKDDEPKMKCSSNTLLIVGVILLFVVIILLVILLVACWMCYPSAKKSGGRPFSKGRRGSSKRNASKHRSSIGAKKSSRASRRASSRATSRASIRASSRAKPTSQASMRAKPRSRVPSRVKHSKGSRL